MRDPHVSGSHISRRSSIVAALFGFLGLVGAGCGMQVKKGNCSNCLGSGRLTGPCAVCNGSGSRGVGNARPVPCQSCGGAGTVAMNCPRCNGTGNVPDGKGR